MILALIAIILSQVRKVLGHFVRLILATIAIILLQVQTIGPPRPLIGRVGGWGEGGVLPRLSRTGPG